jgi:ribosomal protein L19E
VEQKASKEEREELMAVIAKELIEKLVVEGSVWTDSDVKNALIRSKRNRSEKPS